MASAEASAPPSDPILPTSSSLPPTESQGTTSKRLSSMPIEMNSLPASAQQEQDQSLAGGLPPSQTQHNTDGVASQGDTTAANVTEQKQSDTIPNDTTPNPQHQEASPSAPTANTSPHTPSPPPQIRRMDTAPAIGPATDQPSTTSSEASEGPVLFITLLLASTGARHPYRLDGKYLQKRQVEVEGNNPINMSLYKLKELILRDWRSEWDAKPSSPESIRLIFMGKMLNDRSRLTDNGFTNSPNPQIVHMAIKPQEIVDEEEANKATGRDRDGNERSAGCRCVIQ